MSASSIPSTFAASMTMPIIVMLYYCHAIAIAAAIANTSIVMTLPLLLKNCLLHTVAGAVTHTHTHTITITSTMTMTTTTITVSPRSRSS